MFLTNNGRRNAFAGPIAAAALAMIAGAAVPANALVISVPTPFSSLPLDANGVFHVDTLEIAPGGSITNSDPLYPSSKSAGNIKIAVTSALTMDPGSSITAENNFGSGNGGNISITVGDLATGSGAFSMGTGAVISSRKTAGASNTGSSGDISISAFSFSTAAGSVITAGRSTLTDFGSAGEVDLHGGVVFIDGEVSSRSAMGYSYWNQAPGGGPISIIGDFALFIDAPAVISSRGLAPGADLVHIEGGVVDVAGLVESTGDGYVVPTCPRTLVGPSNRPGKPSYSVAGIEVWGDDVVIDGSNGIGGLNADVGDSYGNDTRGWIDVYAANGLAIFGPLTGKFAIHANGGLLTTSDDAGVVTVACQFSSVYANGLAIEADSVNSGGIGGKITIQADTDLQLDTAVLSAKGDFTANTYHNCGGYGGGCGYYSCNLQCFVPCCGGGNNGYYDGYGKGGTIDLTAFMGQLSWTNGIGDVRPTGTGVTASQRGVISLKYGSAINIDANTSFPAIGAMTTPSAPVHVTGGSPVIPGYVNLHD